MTVLEVDGLSVRFGSVTAVERLSFALDEASLVGLIGANGAGKTTVIDALTGFAPVAEGAIRFNGSDITTLKPHDRARRGLARTWQSIELFDDLSVRENLLVGVRGPRRSSRATSDTAGFDRVLERFGLLDALDRLPTELSQGQQKRLGLARALTVQPTVLLADEPAAGLDTTESAALGEDLRALVDDGLTVLLVDHDMSLVLKICDRVLVIERGSLLAEGTPTQIRSDEHVLTAYLGRRVRDSPSAATRGE